MGSSSRYIPALDGLRALAVIAVAIYHMNASVLPCGLLGVTVFFVLSGYLITGLLIREWSSSKTINLPSFWMRRIRRLFPAVAFMLAGTIVLTGIFAPDMLTKLRTDLPAALLFVTNWWYIFRDVSYFEAFAAPSPVTHFWSLAIEEQFYLIWPPLLLLLFKHRVKKAHVQRGILVAAVVSALLMAVLYNPAGDPSRVYYGTDTRAFSLLIGAWMAFEFPVQRVCGRGRSGLAPEQRRLASILGTAALAGMLAMMVLVNGYNPFLYYGGIVVLSVLTGVLMVTLVDARSALARVFALPPLVWLGKLSYSIYLWHYPLLLLMNPRNFTGETPWFAYLGQAAVIIAVSAFSYYFVETPIRRGALGRAWEQLRTRKLSLPQYLRAHIAQAACTIALVAAAAIALVAVPPASTQQHVSKPAGVEQQDPSQANIPDAPAGEDPGETAGAAAEKPGSTLENTPGDTPTEKARNTNFLLIGDSVTDALSEDVYDQFDDAFPNATLDAALSRQLSVAKDIYAQHVEAGWNGPAVIFEMGTNGVATADQIREMVGAVPADKHVFLVNVRTPQPLQDINNELLAQVAQEFDNVELIDWYAYSSGHDDYFDGDGTHLTANAGCPAYLAMLTQALETLHER